MMNSKASIPIEIEIKRELQQAHHNQPPQQAKSSPRHSSSTKITTTTTTTTSSKTKPSTSKENNSQLITDSVSNHSKINKRFINDFENQFVDRVFVNDNNMQNINRQSNLKYNTHSKPQYQHLQNLSPIKPSFVK